ELRSAVLLIAELRVLVDLAAPGDDLLLQAVGELVDLRRVRRRLAPGRRGCHRQRGSDERLLHGDLLPLATMMPRKSGSEPDFPQPSLHTSGSPHRPAPARRARPP